MLDIAIIGGGASGMVAAIKAKRTNNKLNICIFEQLPKIGKKILATGNGRCNITNLNANYNDYNNSEFVKFALNAYSPKKVIVFFESIGLKCIEEQQGRVYPMSNNASTVLDCLKTEIEHLGIEIRTDFKVDEIKNKNNFFIINDSIQSRKILIATGGKASPSQGSDGSGYNFIKYFGHKIVNPYPALVQLKTKENVKSLKGVRVKANVLLINNKKIIDKSCGEVLFTDYGLSGIAIMDISRSVKDEKYECIFDILPNMTNKDISDFILNCKNYNSSNTIINIISGLLPRKVVQYILKKSNINLDTYISNLSNDYINKIIYNIKNLKFDIVDSLGFNNAQITSGGADITQFDNKTMQSKIVINLYCTGEILDIDAPCGGYNLQWAWASGLLAGDNIAKN